MIDLNFNLSTQVAKLTAATTIKPGGSVPVRVTFDAAPGAVSSLKLALGDDATPPNVVAYADTWTAENDNVWTAVLNANDSRLIAWMAGKPAGAAVAELTATIDSVTVISPNVAITVQQRVLSGPGASEGGPEYLTAEEVAEAIAEALGSLQITDGANGHVYRLVTNNGVLGLEQVS